MVRLRQTVMTLVIAFALALSAGQSWAQPNSAGGGIDVPVTGSAGDAGTFAGTFHIQRFERAGDGINAVGTISGVLTTPAGARNVVTAATAPLDLAASGAAAATAANTVSLQQAACEILHLELGPLDLNLLGLVVHLDRIVLDISAQPGAGNLLGNLLCEVAGLLDPLGSLQQIVSLLNRILGLLG